MNPVFAPSVLDLVAPLMCSARESCQGGSMTQGRVEMCMNEKSAFKVNKVSDSALI